MTGIDNYRDYFDAPRTRSKPRPAFRGVKCPNCGRRFERLGHLGICRPCEYERGRQLEMRARGHD